MFFGQFKRIEIDVQAKTFMHTSTNLNWDISFSLVSASKEGELKTFMHKRTLQSKFNF